LINSTARACLRRGRLDERSRRRDEADEIVLVHAKLVRAHDLALAHHHAAEQLGEIFGRADLDEQALHLAEAALALHALGIARKLLDGSHIGRSPGEPVRRALLAFEGGAVDRAAAGHFVADGFDRAVAQLFGGVSGTVEKGNEVGR
jgi:hypothetical protein